jgi:hypothetical protein
MRSSVFAIILSGVTAVATIILCCCCCVGRVALAFAPSSGIFRKFQLIFPSSSSTTSPFLSATTTTSSAADSTKPNVEFPPLSEDKIRKFLDVIPVFAVVDPSKEAIVLLAEQGNANSLVYLSFSPNQINEVYAPLRRAQKQLQQQQEEEAGLSTWEITAFPLGLIWFDLLKNPIGRDYGEPWVVDNIEYRLLADVQQLKEARNVVQQQYARNGARTEDCFQKDYNEIPLFIDDFLRVQQDEDGKSLVPIYFGLEDLLETCQRADTSQGRYQANVNLSDLRQIIQQMQGVSRTNFDQAVLIPLSGPVDTSLPEYEIPTIPTDVESNAEKIAVEIPVMNQWDD